MRISRLSVLLTALTMMVFGQLSPAHAAPVTDRSLAPAGTVTVTFDEVMLTNGTAVTTQFSPFGLTVGATPTTSYTTSGTYPGITVPALDNFSGGATCPGVRSFTFDRPITYAGFNIVNNSTDNAVLSAYNGGMLVETFTFMTSSTALFFIGFENAARFDELRLEIVGTNNSCMLLDDFIFLDDPCGNGMLDAGEQCDDGNTDNTDDCLDTCENATCGDGFVYATVEMCDDGNMDNTDGCLDTCVPASCGDGFVQAGVEDCDDTMETATCNSDCSVAACGDDVVNMTAGEGCDDGVTPPTASTCADVCLNYVAIGADAACVLGDLEATFGYPIAMTPECATVTDEATCNTCMAALMAQDIDCGTSFATCIVDDGNANSDTEPDACRTTCQPAGCNDGVVDTMEGCDDGMANSDTDPDACRTTCMLASCGDGALDTGEACDDGMANSDSTPDACRTMCVVATCGDGVTDSTEGCDDGVANNSDTTPDACRVACIPAACGDGVVDTGEACDEGAANADDGTCSTTCMVVMDVADMGTDMGTDVGMDMGTDVGTDMGTDTTSDGGDMSSGGSGSGCCSVVRKTDHTPRGLALFALLGLGFVAWRRRR